MLFLRILLALVIMLSAGAASRAAGTVDTPCPSTVRIDACPMPGAQPPILPGAQDGASCQGKAIPSVATADIARMAEVGHMVHAQISVPDGIQPAADERPPRIGDR